MDGITRRSRAPEVTPLLPRQVKHALHFMHGHMGERITLAGLSSSCAVPQRTC